MNRRQFLHLLPALGFAQAPGSGAFKAGFAERDITPDIGMEQPGGYGKVFHRALHDACKVRAAVFDDGRMRVALVGIDALMVPRRLVLDSRQAIVERCGILPQAVLIGASHSHSSGPTGMIQPGEYDNADPLVRELAYEKSSCADAGYLERVRAEIVTAVCHADSLRVEARSGFGSGTENQVAYNRRLRMKNGLTYSHPHAGNPDIVGYAGPVDPQVGVVGVWDRQGKLLGSIVNYACHATTNPGGISANWIYYLEKTIRGAMESDAPVVFLQGACGDVTQVDNLSPYATPGAEQWSRLVGGRVGAEAVKVLLAMDPGAALHVAAQSRVLRVQRRVPDPARVQRARETVRKDPKEVGVTEWTFAKETVLLDALIGREPYADAEVQAVQVGPAVFISNPAELFCQFGLDLKKGSKFPLTFPVELANGCVGYVPTEEAFSKHGGGYETRLTSYSNLEPAAGRQMVAAGLELAGAMTPDAAPVRPKAPPFREAWQYGNVPPELR
jgi:neutral ceramidase